MYKVLGRGLLISLYAIGCTSPKPIEVWIPKSENEMRLLVGETVLKALHIYEQYLLEQSRSVPFCPKIPMK